MAVAKEYLFTSPEQLIGQFGKAIGHSARVRIISVLLEGQVISYSSLHRIIPLGRSAFNKHLRILEYSQLVLKDTLEDGLAGYRLNMQMYVHYLSTIRYEFKTTTRLRNVPMERAMEEGA